MIPLRHFFYYLLSIRKPLIRIATLLLPTIFYFNASISYAQTSSDIDSFNTSKLAINQLWELERKNKTLCENNTLGNKTEIRYIGETDQNLINCLVKYQKNKRIILKITSPGGNTETAISAAEIIEKHKWSVEIIGFCLSSCGNYIIPAAHKLIVKPYSIIALHGSNPPSTPQLRDTFQKVRIESGEINDDKLQKELDDDMLRNDIIFQKQNDAALRLGIKKYWLNPDPAIMAIATKSGINSGMWYIDKEMYSSCIGKNAGSYFWQPKNETEWLKLKSLFDKDNFKLIKRENWTKYLCE